MAGKKGGAGENSRKAAGQSRKAEAAANKKAVEESKKAAVEDAEWDKGSKKASAKKSVLSSLMWFRLPTPNNRQYMHAHIYTYIHTLHTMMCPARSTHTQLMPLPAPIPSPSL